MKCPGCGSELIQKSPVRLLLASAVMLAAAIAALFLYAVFWIAAAMFLVIAVYLLAWSTLGKGLWCRRCKSFPKA
jgi:peptidoglycan biosynthesis protein MviN/MurJ (putative lipid II flippase)